MPRPFPQGLGRGEGDGYEASSERNGMDGITEDPVWVKSLLSYANGNCVEVSDLGGEVGVRNSRDREGPVLRFTPDEWQAFIGGVLNGEFDHFGRGARDEEAAPPEGVARWRKRPVVLEGIGWDGTNHAAVREFAVAADGRLCARFDAGSLELWNDQEEAWLPYPVGHVVMRGALGEYYGVSLAALAETFDLAGDGHGEARTA